MILISFTKKTSRNVKSVLSFVFSAYLKTFVLCVMRVKTISRFQEIVFSVISKTAKLVNPLTDVNSVMMDIKLMEMTVLR